MMKAQAGARFGVSVARGLAPVAAAVGVGLLIMILSGVSRALMAVQLVALGLGVALAAELGRGGRDARVLDVAAWGGVAALALTAALGPEVDGARRWLSLGPVRVHTAMLALPPILCASAWRLHEGQLFRALVPPGAAMTLALMQPDASVVAALAFGTLLAVDVIPERPRWYWPLAAGLMVVVAVAWHLRVLVEPVAHTEDIIVLAEQQHEALAVVALIALALAVLGPIIALGAPRPGPGRAAAIALAGAFGALAVFPLLDPWPVPLLGYGASPVIGMCVGVGLTVFLERRAPPEETSLV